MEQKYLQRIQTFNEKKLPDLDEVVMATLEFLQEVTVPTIDTKTFKAPLIIGSGNAFHTGKILFRQNLGAIFADEGGYTNFIESPTTIDAIYIISASGGKHAVQIAEEVQKLNVPVFLITNIKNSPASKFIEEENIFHFPHIREPYTYNTSTYMSMIHSVSGENPAKILSLIENEIASSISDSVGSMEAFTFIVQPRFDTLRPLFVTKFDELFGPKLVGRVFTSEQIKHAKTIVSSDKEFFISFGTENTNFGNEENRQTLPLPHDCGPLALMAIGYYVIGRIQKQYPPYFKDNIADYTRLASEIFEQKIDVIIE